MKIGNIFIKIKDKMQQLYKKNKKLFFVSLAVIVVVFSLFFIPKQDENLDELKSNIEQDSTSSYSQMIELKIENMLSNISAISLVDVMVMVDSSPTINYLTQKESTKTTGSSGESVIEKEEIVYEKNGSSQVPVIVSTTYPKITGVLLVLNNVDVSTKISIQNAVAGVLNISSDSIFILQDR